MGKVGRDLHYHPISGIVIEQSTILGIVARLSDITHDVGVGLTSGRFYDGLGHFVHNSMSKMTPIITFRPRYKLMRGSRYAYRVSMEFLKLKAVSFSADDALIEVDLRPTALVDSVSDTEVIVLIPPGFGYVFRFRCSSDKVPSSLICANIRITDIKIPSHLTAETSIETHKARKWLHYIRPFTVVTIHISDTMAREYSSHNSTVSIPPWYK